MSLRKGYYNVMTNKQLIQRCIDKEPLAWAEFVERFSRLVYWAIKRRLSGYGYSYSEADLEDIHQEVFLAIWQKGKLQTLKAPEKLTSWIAMVAQNAAIDYFKVRRTQPPPNAVALFGQIPQGVGGDPAKQVEGRQLEETLEQAIGSLSSRQQVVVRLHFLHGKKLREIAGILGIRLSIVCVMAARARARLKGRLKELGYEV